MIISGMCDFSQNIANSFAKIASDEFQSYFLSLSYLSFSRTSASHSTTCLGPGRLMELESALLDDCTVNDIYSICNGKTIPEGLRPDVWQVCLDVRHKNDQLVSFNEIFDLPFQRQLREDCDSVVKRLGNDDEDKVSVVSDLESILTFYCKNRSLKYEQGNGWIELLLPLLSLKLRRLVCHFF